MKKTIVFLVLFFLAGPLFSDIRTRYYLGLSFYPGIPAKELKSFASKGLQGLSESDVLGLAQKKYFYLQPEPRDEVPAYKKGCYVLKENSVQRTVEIEEPVRRFVIRMEFAPDKNSAGGRIVKKTMIRRGEVLDTVEYIYGAKGLEKARSVLYGDVNTDVTK